MDFGYIAAQYQGQLYSLGGALICNKTYICIYAVLKNDVEQYISKASIYRKVRYTVSRFDMCIYGLNICIYSKSTT